jgi:hypothetical protein
VGCGRYVSCVEALEDFEVLQDLRQLMLELGHVCLAQAYAGELRDVQYLVSCK